MIIRTRADEDCVAVGPGPYGLALSQQQMELIASLISLVRLGQGHPYREAAYELNTILEVAVGDVQFVHDAYNSVAPCITVDTPDGQETYDGSLVTIEV